jgi:hypothetical protein
MRALEIDNRGNVNVVMALVTTAIVLYVAAIIIAKIGSVATNISSTTEGTMQVQNMSGLAYNALTIASIGLLVLAAMGILSYFGIGFGGRHGRK